MLTGWGDTILIEPVIRSFYKKLAAAGPAPEITIAGNWIRNFPYAQAAYIRGLCPNILSLNDLTRFDFIVNFIPAQLIILISSYRPCGEAVPWPIIFFINNIVFILQLFQNIFYSFLVHIKSQYNLF